MNDQAPRPAATDIAYSEIRRDILSGALAEGERLTEQRLAERLGLSRTPIREAISRLIREGFVERQSGYTTRVARFRKEDLDEIFEIRVMLERYAAERAARFATEDQVQTLRALGQSMTEHTPPRRDEDYEIISQANEQFHKTILEAAQSPRLGALLALASDVGLVARTYHKYSDEDLIRSANHHHEITAAIAARSPAWAASAMSAHILAAAAAASRE